PVDFAAGTVVIFNRTQDEQIVPVSTTLRTSSGVPVEFMTTLTATVPAGTGATTSTTIIALEPGPRGNVPAGQINRFTNPSLGLLVRVINESPTTGGSVRQAGVVTNDDKDRVRSKLRQLIQQAGYDQMVAELDEQEFIPPESLLVIELNLTYNQFAGDVSDTLGAEMQAVVRGTAVGNYHANQLAYAALLKQVSVDYTLLPQGLRFSAGGMQEVADRAVTFPVTAEGIVVADIDRAAIKDAITFMPIGQAQEWVSRTMPIVSVPGIDVSPNWLGRLPVFPFRIKVVVNDVSPLIFGSDE
ncbi:MAG: baseplate J/gp47 family protein, partial [Anaerolineae bacterium]